LRKRILEALVQTGRLTCARSGPQVHLGIALQCSAMDMGWVRTWSEVFGLVLSLNINCTFSK